MATVLCYFDYDMPYHDIMTSVDDEDETYHKTEWSLPSTALIVYIMSESSWSISLLSFYILLLQSTNHAADSDLKLEVDRRQQSSSAETGDINLPFVVLRRSFATMQ